MDNKRYWLRLGVIAGVISLIVCVAVLVHFRQRIENTVAGSSQTPRTQSSSLGGPVAGSKFIPFRLSTYPEDKPISTSDYAGKPLFINFWASWCDPCKRETPDLVKAYAKYGDNVQFIGVNLTAQDSMSDVAEFIRQYEIKYPVALDKDGTVGNEYGVIGIPTSIFINHSGVVVTKYTGAIPSDTLQADLEKIGK